MINIYERQSFLGARSTATFSKTRVTVIGLGGGGSHIIQQLAHLGIGDFLIIDPDRVEFSNLNRLVGATYRDAESKTSKVAVGERLIKAVNPKAVVDVQAKKWQQCHELMRGTHVIFGCVDSYSDRDQIERLARRFLIPYIDIGMDVHKLPSEFAISGQVILSMPGGPCMRCMGFLKEDLLAQEAQQYGAAGGRPQVVWSNGILASVAVGLFVSVLTPWAPRAVSELIEYNGNIPAVRPDNRLLYLADKKCSHFDVTELGDPFWQPSLPVLQQ